MCGVSLSYLSHVNFFSFLQSDIKRLRSMSDGATGGPPGEDIFPSLPDSVLEKMGLLGDRTR